MSMSLFDVSSLTGLPCTGEEISALLTLPPGVEYNAESKPSYPAFVRSAYDKSPTKEFIPLAAVLAYGRQLALGPFLLTHLYRSCQDITAHYLVISARDLLTYGFMFKNVVENKKSFEECFKFFASLSIDRPDANFAVFPGKSHGPSCSMHRTNSAGSLDTAKTYHSHHCSPSTTAILFAPPPLTKKFEEKKVVKESEDLESTMAAQMNKLDLPMRAPKTQVKRKIATPADSTEEITPSKQRRTEGIKRSAVKPSAAKKLIKSTSPSRSTSTTETETQPDKTEGVSLGPAATTNPVEDISAESGESNSDSSRTKSGDGSSLATKVRDSRFSSRIANKCFKTVRPNELINLSPDKENTPTPVASPVRHVHVDDIESVAIDVPMIDDDLEDELLAQLDMLMDPSAKSGSATDSKGKAVAEEANFDINLPTQEQISFAIMTMQELLDDFTTIYTHLSKRFRVLESKVAAAESVRKSVADSTVVVFKKKEEFLAAKEAHVTQVKHLQELKEEISNLEAKLLELRNQVLLAE
ncbi:hypothetical protein SLEP1_g42194 [Rubroshorea leprosula]|uniref:Uncharacterized protein n=1 Tax=Rubroshorea leprosula TaxID=152421 RepID=A0AAV5L906_9ROSI|nr:hypothetical protein SLEP1_g42194 [Rubroshorea leprosula]